MVGNPLPGFGGRYWVFLKLVTDGGVVGYGEAYSLPFHPRVVEDLIQDVCQRYVLGSDPFRIEWLWRQIYSSGYSQRSGIVLMAILSAVEMACWDIVGKELNRPVYGPIPIFIQRRMTQLMFIWIQNSLPLELPPMWRVALPLLNLIPWALTVLLTLANRRLQR